jgi:hypothetical protein
MTKPLRDVSAWVTLLVIFAIAILVGGWFGMVMGGLYWMVTV